ncbi:MAG TPA: hypothetical protein VFR47_33040 [Anaerolineales bacterium]|nr:hypothetical protein [Anaerolineales bacterium]
MQKRFVLFFAMLALILSACGATNEPAATSVPLPTDTAAPLPPEQTATPVVPLAILVLPATLDAESSNLYQKTVYDLTQASGMRFQVRNSLTPADLEPGLQMVIALAPDPGIAALAVAAPNVQFLAINIPEVTPGGNISVLGGSAQSDIAAFLAGYTAALITDDYRIGMLMPRDNADAIRAYNAYVHGMMFHCGTCRPIYSFAWSYPQYVDIAADEDVNNYHAYADILILQYKVRTIYLYPDVATEDLMNYIGTTGTLMIGTKTPEQLPGGWVMTIQPDVVKAIQNAWPQLIGGQGGVTVQSPLGLSDIDPGLLSPGKQRVVEQMLQDLQAGLVAP